MVATAESFVNNYPPWAGAEVAVFAIARWLTRCRHPDATVRSHELDEGEAFHRKLSRSLSSTRPTQADKSDLTVRPPKSPSDLTKEWLDFALRLDGAIPHGLSIESFEVSPTTIQGFLSEVVRVKIRYCGNVDNITTTCSTQLPTSVILKMQAVDPDWRDAAMEANAYDLEAAFFRDLARELGENVHTPHCFNISLDPDTKTWVLLIEDLTLHPEFRGADQLVGLSDEDILNVVKGLAPFHAAFWNDSRLDTLCSGILEPFHMGTQRNTTQWFKTLFTPFMDSHMVAYMQYIYGGSDEGLKVMRLINANVDWLREQLEAAPTTIVHADLRADNLFLAPPVEGSTTGRTYLLDWQLVGTGSAMFDVAWFVCGTIDPGKPSRVAFDRSLVEAYWVGLKESGVDAEKYTLEQCWREYLVASLWCCFVPFAIFNCNRDSPLPRDDSRGSQIVKSIIVRHLTAVRELGALDLNEPIGFELHTALYSSGIVFFRRSRTLLLSHKLQVFL
mmetsp:Transcript_3785/g.13515  ORF Transcript_3785/g.13515 Transcript_3785/m.13515 type:complete len:503 (+) Transcript_3785:128-1636(+)